MLRKFILSLTLACLLLTSFLFPLSSSINAQNEQQPQPGSGAPEEGTWFNQNFFDWADKVYDPDNSDEIFGERYTAAQVSWIFFSTLGFLLNQAPFTDPDINWCMFRKMSEAQEDSGLVAGTIEGAWTYSTDCHQYIYSWLSELTQGQESGSSSSTPQLAKFFPNTTHFLNSKFTIFSIVPEAKAQGFGYGAIDVIRGLWQVSRNISYFLLVIATIILAFLVMFRAKISPQTVVTAQSAIPKIILALVVITFSYAIGGLIIDLMYVVLGLVITLLINSDLLQQGAQWTTVWSLVTETSIFEWLIYYLVNFYIAIETILLMLTSIPALAKGLGGIIFALTIVFAIAVMAILALRVIWFLIKNYVTIILQIAFSPFYIIGGFVSQGAGFGNWIKNLISNLMVYPVVTIMLFLAFVFLAPSLPNEFRGQVIQSNLGRGIGGVLFNTEVFANGNDWNPPFGWGTDQSAIIFLVASVVMITLLPKVGEIVKSLISGKPIVYGSALKEALGPGAWGIGLGLGAYERSLANKATNKEVAIKNPAIANDVNQQFELLQESVAAKRSLEKLQALRKKIKI